MQQSPGHLVSLIALNRAAGWPWQDGRDWWPLAGSRAAAIMIPDLGRDAKGHHDCQPGRGVQMRCLECGAESAEAARVCARCGAPVARQTSAGADPAEGGSGDPIAPPAGDGLHQPAGQRPEPSNPPWVRNALVLACLGLVALVAVTALAWSVPTLIARSSSSASPRSSVSASPRSSASSVPATGHLTIYQLRAGDCLQDYSGVTFFNEGNGPFTAELCTRPHAAEVFSQAMPGRGHRHTWGMLRLITAEMRAAARRSARMTESPTRFRHLILSLLIRTGAPGLAVIGGWCVSPSSRRTCRWTIRSEAAVSNGGLSQPGDRPELVGDK